MLLTFSSVMANLGQPDLGPRASLAWGRLTAASHHHVHELPPTETELDHVLNTVHDVIEAIRTRQAATRQGVTRATGS